MDIDVIIQCPSSHDDIICLMVMSKALNRNVKNVARVAHKQVPLVQKETGLSLHSLPKATVKLPLGHFPFDTAHIPLRSASQSKGAKIFTSPLFTLKAVPSHLIPPRIIHPFELAFRDQDRMPKIPFQILTTIKGVSKRAVERNRVRTRFKEAIRLVLTRGKDVESNGPQSTHFNELKAVKDPAEEIDPFRLVLPNHHYSATLTPGIYSEPMTNLINQVRKGLEHCMKPSSKKPSKSPTQYQRQPKMAKS